MLSKYRTNLWIESEVIRKLEGIRVLFLEIPELLAESYQHSVQPAQYIRAVVICFVTVNSDTCHQGRTHLLVKSCSYVLDVGYRISPAEERRVLDPITENKCL